MSPLEQRLDVRELEPPEPLERSLAAARALGATERLRIIHWREPFPLYASLEREGFEHTVTELGEHFEILVWRRATP